MAPMMQGSAMSRVFSGAGSAGPRRLALIGGSAVVLLAAVGVIVMHGHHSTQKAAVAKLPDVNAEPGGMHSNSYYNQLALQQAQQQAKTAAAAGQSSVAPMAAGAVTQPPAVQAVLPPPVSHPVVRPVPPGHLQAEPVTYTPPQPAQATAPDPQQQKQQNQLYAAAIGSMLAGWGNGPAPVTQVYIDPTKSEGTNAAGPGTGAIGSGPHTELASTTSGTQPTPTTAPPPATVLIPAGKGVYARSKLAANSDTGGPVVITAESGPIAGDDMTGTFERRADRLVITLNTITLQDGEQKSIDALVIAPDSMETAVASSVNQHYISRFVLPVAAAFVAGLGQAIEQSNATVAVSPLGGYTSQNHLNFDQQLGIAAGAAGSQLQNMLIQAAPNGPTVKLAAGANVGVIFLKPLTADAAQ